VLFATDLIALQCLVGWHPAKICTGGESRSQLANQGLHLMHVCLRFMSE